MTTTWTNIKICRICSSPAEYDVFSKIPSYLHSNIKEASLWPKCISAYIEETTGLKISTTDGLPHNICAICISYLKHAATFRLQTINNAMSLKAVLLLNQKQNITQNLTATKKPNAGLEDLDHPDKQSLLIDEQDLNFQTAAQRSADTNVVLNNDCLVQNKVSHKQLLGANFQNNFESEDNVVQQLQYLNKLFNKDPNFGMRPIDNAKRNGAAFNNRRANVNNDAAVGFYNKADYIGSYDEEFQTTTSSDETETNSNSQKPDIFSYSEKMFEEDDIMDMEELRNVISINIPESCKERKCRACYRRSMFDDTFRDHLENCIEYKFLTYIEEINRLLVIRRSKAISPHEYIRRMIFCLRKTCEWLKANCDDSLLPDLDQNYKEPVEMAHKTNLLNHMRSEHDLTANVKKKQTEGSLNNSTSLFKNELTTTPINISNNILYEIERCQSRGTVNSKQTSPNKFNSSYNNVDLKKPIPVLATSGPKATVAATLGSKNFDAVDVDRRSFMQKLQQAAVQSSPSPHDESCKIDGSSPIFNCEASLKKPVISVRKDMHARSPFVATQTALSFSARCNPCDLIFETLASLEIHNAMVHNNTPSNNCVNTCGYIGHNYENDDERQKIIALFEDDSPDED